MIAHLGMYSVPGANAALWIQTRMALGYGPDTLTSSDDYWQVWQHPDLLFSQTCGYPYRARLHGEVQLIGTPDYGLQGCPPGYYRSVFVRRKADTRHTLAAFDGARFAYNEALSQSGWAAPITRLLDQNLKPGTLLETGAHAASAIAVADDRADFAALDALTWTLILRSGMQVTDDLVAFAETTPTPGLPYITGPKGDPVALFNALSTAITQLPPETRDRLHLRGLTRIPAEAYLAVPTPPAPSALLTP